MLCVVFVRDDTFGVNFNLVLVTAKQTLSLVVAAPARVVEEEDDEDDD